MCQRAYLRTSTVYHNKNLSVPVESGKHRIKQTSASSPFPSVLQFVPCVYAAELGSRFVTYIELESQLLIDLQYHVTCRKDAER